MLRHRLGPKGAAGRGDRAVACANIQNELHAEDPATHPRDARTAYNLGAGDLFKLDKSLRGDEPAKIIYHSHVDVGAYFSDTDQAAAQMDGEPTYPVEYVVIDVRSDGVRGAAQFAWDAAARRYVEVGRYPAPTEGARLRAFRAGAHTMTVLATAEPWDLVAAHYAAEALPYFEVFSREALRIAGRRCGPPLVADIAAGPRDAESDGPPRGRQRW